MAAAETIREVRVADCVEQIDVDELPAYVAKLEPGPTDGPWVEVLREGKVIALVRASRARISESLGARPIPDFAARLTETWGEKPLDTDSTAIIREDRDARG